MAVGAAIDPDLCRTQPMRIEIDDKGYRKVANGKPNANVCLESDSDRFFHFYLPTVMNQAGPGELTRRE
jgi:hypothetical protein